MQLAVENVEAVEAHLGLHDRRITYTRAVHQRRTVARRARGVVVEFLLLRAATASSHVSPLPRPELRTRTVHNPSPSRFYVRSSRATTATARCRRRRRSWLACRDARAPRQMARPTPKQLFHRFPSRPDTKRTNNLTRPLSSARVVLFVPSSCPLFLFYGGAM